MGRVGKAGVVLLVLLAGIAAVLIGFAKSEFTECFAYFKSRANAEQALTAAREQGLDGDLHNKALGISSGETGSDAEGFRNSVRRLVAANEGRMERGGGCIERPHFN